jgi:hypothetical protein
MNLQDLRDELSARATTPDNHADDLLPGVRRKIRRTKQRRVATAVGTVATITALAIAVVPSVIDTSTPHPADKTPADITKHGITLSGVDKGNRLETGTIGDPGENKLSIDWAPATHDVAFSTRCRSSTDQARYWLRVNGQTAAVGACPPALETAPDVTVIRPYSSVWLDVPSDRPVSVTLDLVDARGKQLEDNDAQLALGIYRYGGGDRADLPFRVPPPAPGDYEKDGVRFRARAGGDTLSAAQVSDRGQGQVSMNFPAPVGPLVLHEFCTADSSGIEPAYELRISFNGVVRATPTCSSSITDAAQGSAITLDDVAQPGEQVVATAVLVDRYGKPVSMPAARIGLGVYQQGKQRAIGDGVSLGELKEYRGYVYRLAELRTVDAVSEQSVELATPPGTPFLISYGSTDLGPTEARVMVSGLSVQSTGSTGGGIGTIGEAARPAGTASAAIAGGNATKGKLILALYLPAG